MGEFLNVGTTRTTKGGFKVVDPYRYYSSLYNKLIIVPGDFFTDLASIPKIVPRWIIDTTTGANRDAAIVHDLLCYPEYQKLYRVSQADADKIFREALIDCGVAGWRIAIMFNAVRAFQFAKLRRDYWSIPK